MAREEGRSGFYEEQEAAFLAPKIPLEKKCAQHSSFTAHSVRTFCNQEPLSGPGRAPIQSQVRFQYKLFLVTLLARHSTAIEGGGLH